MEIYKDKALIVNTNKPDDILNSIDKSTLLKTFDNGVSKVVVKWGLDEVLKLSALEIYILVELQKHP